MKSVPLVTIVIPTYNGGITIERTIDSVLSQTYKNFEIIILNNCSTDDTLSKIEKYNDERIKVVNNASNIGFEGNWNKSLECITGKYFKLLPDDDLLEPKSLELMILEMEKNEDIVLTTSKRKIIDENDKTILVHGKNICNGQPIELQSIIKEIYRYASNPLGEPGAVLIRSRAIKSDTKFDMSVPYFIDLDFYLKILKEGSLYFIDLPLYSFRIWGRSYSIENQSKQFFDTKDFFKNWTKNYDFITFTDKMKHFVNLYKTRTLKYFFYKWLNFVK